MAREVVQERPNLTASHFSRMTFAVEQHEAPDPVDISFLGTKAVASQAYFRPGQVQEPVRSWHGT
jgi:hypothetical protein